MSSEPIPKTQLAAVSDSAEKGVEIREIPVVQPDELKPGKPHKQHASGVDLMCGRPSPRQGPLLWCLPREPVVQP